MARPTKLTPEAQRRISEAVAAGNYYEAAAYSAGVDYRTFRRWMERGEKSKNGLYYQFCQAIRQAEAQAEVRMVAQWQQQIPESWQAARDFLARRHPERWGPKDKHTLAGDPEHPLRLIELTWDGTDNRENHNQTTGLALDSS